jgi:hypothetical protein
MSGLNAVDRVGNSEVSSVFYSIYELCDIVQSFRLNCEFFQFHFRVRGHQRTFALYNISVLYAMYKFIVHPYS